MRLNVWEFEARPPKFYEKQGYRTVRCTIVALITKLVADGFGIPVGSFIPLLCINTFGILVITLIVIVVNFVTAALS